MDGKARSASVRFDALLDYVFEVRPGDSIGDSIGGRLT
jgi:hypothetical protein